MRWRHFLQLPFVSGTAFAAVQQKSGFTGGEREHCLAKARNRPHKRNSQQDFGTSNTTVSMSLIPLNAFSPCEIAVIP